MLRHHPRPGCVARLELVMQLIWMSGPTGRVRSWRITVRQILWGGAAIVVSIFVLGLLLNLAGWRLAVSIAPTVASVVGGVTSASEQERREARFHAQLGSLESQLRHLQGELGHVKQSRDKLVQEMGLVQLLAREPAAERIWPFGRGGPLLAWPLADLPGRSLEARVQRVERGALGLDEDVVATRQRWLVDAQRLEALPLALPLQAPFRMTSGFGLRADPFTGQPSLHEGVDLVAEVGAPVLATASGTVSRSEHSGELGQWVEVTHAHGFATRYGHLHRRAVEVGQVVARGSLLGGLGNSGRSSGPHLHYEVLHDGRALSPQAALAQMGRLSPPALSAR